MDSPNQAAANEFPLHALRIHEVIWVAQNPRGIGVLIGSACHDTRCDWSAAASPRWNCGRSSRHLRRGTVETTWLVFHDPSNLDRLGFLGMANSDVIPALAGCHLGHAVPLAALPFVSFLCIFDVSFRLPVLLT